MSSTGGENLEIHVNRGKHRTEVTEVTEWDWVYWPKIFGERPELPGEIHVNGKASHRGHGGHRGGIGFAGQKSLVDALSSRARST
jgi:hypothetical protein